MLLAVVFFTVVRAIMILMLMLMVRAEGRRRPHTAFEKWRYKFMIVLFVSNVVDIWLLYSL